MLVVKTKDEELKKESISNKKSIETNKAFAKKTKKTNKKLIKHTNPKPPKKPKKNKNSGKDNGSNGKSKINSFFNPSKLWLWILIGAIIIIGVILFISSANAKEVPIDLFVMSMCPYGTQAENEIIPIAKQVGGDINLYFIVTENPDGTFNSLHGQPEVNENIRQLCALEQNKDKAFNYILCRNKNMNGNWEACAKEVGLDVEKVSSCFNGDEGKNLLKENLKVASSNGISASPTIFINNEQYGGARDGNSFKKEICNAHDGIKPLKCIFSSQETTHIILLNDKRCNDCDTTQLVLTLKRVIPELDVEEVDYSSSKGKEIYEKTGIINLPAVLFKKDITSQPFFAQLAPYMDEVGKYYSLRIGSKFNPTKEVCYNGIDDTGNGLVDCDDPDCEASFDCREEKPKTLDLFVMSMCPYGKLALDSMKEVFDNFGKDNLNFNIYFIASQNPDGTFNSLHGQPEVEEDLREVCVIKKYPKDYKYMEYIWCRNKDMNANWQDCAEENGMDVQIIKECSEGEEGKILLSKSIEVTRGLGIGASPTWIANNKYMFNGIDAETIKTNFCNYNNIDGCDSKLTGNTGTPSGQC